MTPAENRRLQECWHMLKNCQLYRQAFEEMWKIMFRQWECKLNETGWPVQSMIFYPYAYQVVEQLTMRLVGMGGFPPLNVRGRHPGYDELAPSVIAWLQWCWRVNKMRYKLIHFFKAGQIYGTSYAMIPYRVEVKKFKRWVPNTFRDPFTNDMHFQTNFETGGFEREFISEYVTTMDQPGFEYTHPGDVWVPLGYSGLDEDAVDGKPVPFLIHRTYATLKELKEGQKHGVKWRNLDEVAAFYDTTMGGKEDDWSKDDVLRMMGVDTHMMADDEDEGVVPLYYYWTSDRLSVMANLDVLIYDGDNPFAPRIPFVAYRDVINSGHFYGLSEIWFTEGLQDALNAMGNLMMTHLDLSVNPPTFFDSQALNGVKDFDLEPGKMVPMRTRGGLGVKEFVHTAGLPPLNNDVYHFWNNTSALYEEVTGVTKSIKGVTGGAELATEVANAAQNANQKFQQKLTTIHECVYLPLFKQWTEMGQKFMDDEKMFHLLGSLAHQFQQVPVSPEILGLDWIFEFEPDSTIPYANPEDRRNRAIELLNLGLNPEFAPYIKMDQLLDIVMRDGFGFNYPERIIKSRQEMDSEERQMQMQAAQEEIAQNILANQVGNGMGAQSPEEAIQLGIQGLSPYSGNQIQ